MTQNSLAVGHLVYLGMLNSGKIENGLGGEVKKGKQKSNNTHHWSLKGLKPGMKRPNMMGHYKPIHTFTGERL